MTARLFLTVLITSFRLVPSVAQDQVDPKVRLYAQRVHIYLNRVAKSVDPSEKKPRDVIRELMVQKAKQFELSEDKQKEVAGAVARALGEFARELGQKWMNSSNVKQISTDGTSLQTSTLLFETSEAWNTELAKLVDQETLKRWNADRDKRLGDAKKQRDAQMEQLRQQQLEAERRKRAVEMQRAQQTMLAFEQQFPRMMDAGAARQVLRSIEQCLTHRKLALEHVLQKEVAAIAAAVPLNAKQRRRFALAAKGVVAKDAHAVEGLIERVKEIEGDLPEELVQELRGIISISRIPQTSKFWQTSLRAALGEEGLAAYERERKSAREFERDAWIRNVIVLFQNATPLSIVARQKLLDGLMAAEIPTSTLATRFVAASTAYNAIPDEVRADTIDTVLSAQQVEKIKNHGNAVVRALGGGFGNPGFNGAGF